MASVPQYASQTQSAMLQAMAARGKTPGTAKDKARDAATDFEAVFLNSMFSEMFSGMEGTGPMGNSPGIGVWRSFLTDEYAKSFAKSGGVGIADQVYRSLLALQEARPA